MKSASFYRAYGGVEKSDGCTTIWIQHKFQKIGRVGYCFCLKKRFVESTAEYCSSTDIIHGEWRDYEYNLIWVWVMWMWY